MAFRLAGLGFGFKISGGFRMYLFVVMVVMDHSI